MMFLGNAAWVTSCALPSSPSDLPSLLARVLWLPRSLFMLEGHLLLLTEDLMQVCPSENAFSLIMFCWICVMPMLMCQMVIFLFPLLFKLLLEL